MPVRRGQPTSDQGASKCGTCGNGDATGEGVVGLGVASQSEIHTPSKRLGDGGGGRGGCGEIVGYRRRATIKKVQPAEEKQRPLWHGRRETEGKTRRKMTRKRKTKREEAEEKRKKKEQQTRARLNKMENARLFVVVDFSSSCCFFLF